MKIKFWAFLAISVIFIKPTSPLLSSLENNSENIPSSINVDYLKRLPKNDYIVGPGDTLNVIVSRDYPELDSIATIDGEGTIYLPKLNRIFVKDLNIRELNKLLTEAYDEYIKYPSLEVEIAEYRPIRVLIEGEVENPGLRTLPGSFQVNNTKISNLKESLNFYFPTVFDAIRSSGGITPNSDLKNVKIIRNNNLSEGGGKITTTINFEEVIISGANDLNIRIYDSDIIKIPKSNNQNDLIFRKAVLSNLNPKFIEVFVSGRVNRPGRTKLSKASVLSDAIDVAGGARALKGKVRFIRFNNDGTIEKRKFRFRRRNKRGSYENPLLRNGDLIVVGDSLVNISNEVISEITAPFVGVFSAYGILDALTN